MLEALSKYTTGGGTCSGNMMPDSILPYLELLGNVITVNAYRSYFTMIQHLMFCGINQSVSEFAQHNL